MTKPKLLDQMRDVIRLHQYSRDTERAYLHWVKRFILFHGKEHPLFRVIAGIEFILTQKGSLLSHLSPTL